MTDIPDRSSPTAARILAAATLLFLEHGPQPVSADRVIEAAKVSKVTFYRHYHSKNDLVVAFIDQQSLLLQHWLVDCTRRTKSAREAVMTLMTESVLNSDRPSCLGNVFVITGSQYADPNHVVNAAVARHHSTLIGLMSNVLRDSLGGSAEPVATALCALRNGALLADRRQISAKRWLPGTASAVIASALVG